MPGPCWSMPTTGRVAGTMNPCTEASTGFTFGPGVSVIVTSTKQSGPGVTCHTIADPKAGRECSRDVSTHSCLAPPASARKCSEGDCGIHETLHLGEAS